MRTAVVRHKRAIKKHRLERAFLLDALARQLADKPGTESDKSEEEEEEESPPPSVRRDHHPCACPWVFGEASSWKLTGKQPLEKPARGKRKSKHNALTPPPPDVAPLHTSPPDMMNSTPAAAASAARDSAPRGAAGGGGGSASFVAFEPPTAFGRSANGNSNSVGNHSSGGKMDGVNVASSPGAEDGPPPAPLVRPLTPMEEVTRSNGHASVMESREPREEAGRRGSGDVSMTEDGPAGFMAVNRWFVFCCCLAFGEMRCGGFESWGWHYW
jgi:hypothetical protein